MYKFTNQIDRQRLDNFLMVELSKLGGFTSLSRSQLKILITTRGILINNTLIYKAGCLLKINDSIEIDLENLQRPREFSPYDYPLNIVFEDQDLLVINKSFNLTVHPGAGNPNRTLLNALVNYLGKDQQVYLVHRLDKDTTGLILVAKNELTRMKLIDQFVTREVKRVYQALALVTPRSNREIQKFDSGKTETKIARNANNKLAMAVTQDAGKVAITNWKVLEKFSYAYLLQLRLETGRTHQIRVHLNHLGSPIIGDQTYGDFSLLPKELAIASKAFGRQALHAKELQFVHPRDGKLQVIKSDLPEDFLDLINKFTCYR